VPPYKIESLWRPGARNLCTPDVNDTWLFEARIRTVCVLCTVRAKCKETSDKLYVGVEGDQVAVLIDGGNLERQLKIERAR
jgi:hypothetical protein